MRAHSAILILNKSIKDIGLSYPIFVNKACTYDNVKIQSHWCHKQPKQTLNFRPACIGSMLAQRRRRWANIEPTQDPHLVFSGTLYT